jgi:hypothetical protein
MESKDYERHSDTNIFSPAHVALRCDNRLPIWEQQRVMYVHPTLYTRAGLGRNWNALHTADKDKPANQDQALV